MTDQRHGCQAPHPPSAPSPRRGGEKGTRRKGRRDDRSSRGTPIESPPPRCGSEKDTRRAHFVERPLPSRSQERNTRDQLFVESPSPRRSGERVAEGRPSPTRCAAMLVNEVIMRPPNPPRAAQPRQRSAGHDRPPDQSRSAPDPTVRISRDRPDAGSGEARWDREPDRESPMW